jgi:hypothetical protein
MCVRALWLMTILSAPEKYAQVLSGVLSSVLPAVLSACRTGECREIRTGCVHRGAPILSLVIKTQ